MLVAFMTFAVYFVKHADGRSRSWGEEGRKHGDRSKQAHYSFSSKIEITVSCLQVLSSEDERCSESGVYFRLLSIRVWVERGHGHIAPPPA